MNIFLCTIPHTGTNFFYNMFVEAGFVPLGFGYTKDQLLSPSGGKGWITRCHVSRDTVRAAREAHKLGSAIVTTDRPYDETVASWKARGKSISDLHKAYLDQEELMDSLYPVYVITFDEHNYRAERIGDLEHALGVKLNPQWDKPMNVRKKK